MDDAEANYLNSAIRVNTMLWCVGGRGGYEEALVVKLREIASSADLGGSSKYSNENFEDWSGEGFHVNSNWTWVSRS